MTNRWTPSFSRAFIVEHTSPCFMACHTRKRDKRSRRVARLVELRALPTRSHYRPSRWKKKGKHDGARKRIDWLAPDWYHRRMRFYRADPNGQFRLQSRYGSSIDFIYPPFFRQLVIRVVNAARAHLRAISPLMTDGRCGWWRMWIECDTRIHDLRYIKAWCATQLDFSLFQNRPGGE